MSSQLDVRIVEARLVRIFDSLKPNQDVFVQLVCGYEDGSEKVVGRTEVCKNGNLAPRWNQRFLCGRDASSGGRTLKFKVHIDHVWRNPVLCGEAEFGLDNLWRRASGRAQEVPVPLFKKGEQTGLLNISIALQGAGYSVGNQMNLEPSPAHAQGAGPHWMDRTPGPMPDRMVQQPARDFHVSSVGVEAQLARHVDASKPLPAEFLCPISHEVMRDPVSTCDGHTYDRKSIEQWLRKSTTSPSTGLPLANLGLVPNHTLRKLIEGYFGGAPAVGVGQGNDQPGQVPQDLRRQQEQRQQEQWEQRMQEQKMQEQRIQEQRMQEQRMQEQRMQEQRMQEQRVQEQRMQEQRQHQAMPRAVLAGSYQMRDLHTGAPLPQYAQDPIPPSPGESFGTRVAVPAQPAEVKGVSCGWCRERSPKAQLLPSSPSAGKSPTSDEHLEKGGQSGQWWNSFIDRG